MNLVIMPHLMAKYEQMSLKLESTIFVFLLGSYLYSTKDLGLKLWHTEMDIIDS